MEFHATVRRLEQALGDDLPGPEAHLRMVTRPRPGWRPGVVPDDSRPAAVLIAVYPREGDAFVPLTLRAEGVESHRGQVSLPGGALDPGEDAETGAVREAEEELGIAPDGVRVLGRLTPLFIPPSGFAVHPVVGLLDRAPEFRPAPEEVAEVYQVPLARLTRPGGVVRGKVRVGAAVREVMYFPVAGQRVWGATAMILAEFVSLLGARPWDPAGDASDDVEREGA